jgi:hypothetical protein
MEIESFLQPSEMWSKDGNFYEVFYREKDACIAIVQDKIDEDIGEPFKVGAKIIPNKVLATEYKLLKRDEVPKDLVTLNNMQKTKIVENTFAQLDF